MVCIYCNHKTKVTNSRTSANAFATWRRRECTACGSIITTREQVDYTSALRVSGKSLEPFSRDKLLISLHDALTHRKTSLEDARELTDTIIKQLLALHTNGVLSSSVIRETAQVALERFDSVGGVYYRAHHHSMISG